MDFCHLHVHDTYSILDGVGTPEEYAKLCKFLGMNYLAQTNHGNINGSISHQKACLSNGITPIFGCEGYVVPDGTIKTQDKPGHIIVLVKELVGWKNLLKMLNVANNQYFHKKPMFDYDLLLKHNKGLFFLTGCISSFVKNTGGLDFLLNLNDESPGNVFLEAMPFLKDSQIEWNNKLLQIHTKYNIPMVVSNDCHYPKADDNLIQDVLLAIQTKVKWQDKNRWCFDYRDLYLKSPRRMAYQLEKQGVLNQSQINLAMANSINIASNCHFRVEKTQVDLPIIKDCIDSGLTTEDFFVKLCNDRLELFLQTIDKDATKYRDRFKNELEVILLKNFDKYFLIVWELISWSKNNGILIGPGRGSVSGSLIAYLLGITNIDPIRHGLLFERFISLSRVEFPDIDIDVDAEKRGLIKQHLSEEYGQNHVANIATYLKMKGKMVLRDVARVFDVPEALIAPVAEIIEEDLEDVFENTTPGKIFKEKYELYTDVMKRMEGQIRAVGSHAGGFIIAKRDLTTSGQVVLVQGNNISVNWDKEDSEFVGLLKLDLLGLSALSIIQNALDLIKQNYGLVLDLNHISLEDDKIFREFSEGNTVGCFQFNTIPLSKICKRVKPADFQNLVNLIAVYRPALIQRGVVEEFLLNKEKGWSDPNPILNDILKISHGIILYQEQLMLLVNKLSGMTLFEAEEIRKTFNKKGGSDLDKYQSHFIEGAIKNGLSKEKATNMWEYLSSNSGYGFNLSHSVGYTMLSYMDMFLKVYYPIEFICANLNYGSDDKKQSIVDEALRLGIKINPPRIGKSSESNWTIKDNQLFCPFIELKGIGPKFSEKLAKINISNRSFFDSGINIPDGIMSKINNPMLPFNLPKYNESKIFTLTGNHESNLWNLSKLDVPEIINKDKLIVDVKWSWSDSKEKLNNCTNCDLCKRGRINHGKIGRKNLMICGESPNNKDGETGDFKPGVSYKLLIDCLDSLHIDSNDFYWTNMIKCALFGKKIEPLNIRSCKKWMDIELKAIQPIMVLSLGSIPGIFFSKEERFGIVAKNGTIAWNEEYNTWVCYVLHPGFVYRDSSRQHLFHEGLLNFVEGLCKIGYNLK